MKITMNGVGNWYQLSVSVIMSANDVMKTIQDIEASKFC